MEQKDLLILGCGWVGTELAIQQLRQGRAVWATTRSKERCNLLIAQGIKGATHDFDNSEPLAIPRQQAFGTIVVSVPASRKLDSRGVKDRFKRLCDVLVHYHYDRLIFLSSVGVYPDRTGRYDENYREVESLDINLLAAEKQMQTLPRVTVFRLGGLFGKDRIFAKYFQQRICETGNQRANFIHLDDVVELIIRSASPCELPHGVYNLVTPEHPLKKEVILAGAAKYGLEKPSGFQEKHVFEKIVSSEKISRLMDYRFKYPSPLEF